MASKMQTDGEGSVYQRHAAKFGCPATVDGRRPQHECSAPWVGVYVSDWKGGRPIRRKVSGRSKTSAKNRLRELRDKIHNGRLPSGRVPTVAEWMTYWLENIAAERNRPSTLAAYGTYVNRYIIPLLGDRRLDRLTPEHLTTAWRHLTNVGCPGKTNPKPLSSTSAHQAHVILSRALKVALERGIVTRNVASLMDAPSVSQTRMQVLTREQARSVVAVAQRHRNAARWTVAFSLGLRQGEALGLRWPDVDLERGILRVTNSLGRVTGKGLVLGPVKSRAGQRGIMLPKPLLAELKAHRAAQNAERLAAGTFWEDTGHVFTTEAGRPIDPKADWRLWRERLADAEVPVVRLHAARHTAITMLLAMGVKPQVVKEIAGHAKFSTTEVYVDKVDELHLDAAERMAAFWQ